jgi:antirestriction protein
MQIEEITITDSILERLQEYGFDTYEELEEAIADHKSDCRLHHPAVFCGTYYKYNIGYLDGMWIDITSFVDYDDFINFCKAIHANEPDPELMFQDYEYFPEDFYSESGIDEDDFYNILEYGDMCTQYPAEVVDAYVSNFDVNELDKLKDRYQGEYDSEEDFARHLVEDVYPEVLKKMGELSIYFDYEAYADELFSDEYDFVDGYVFNRSC